MLLLAVHHAHTHGNGNGILGLAAVALVVWVLLGRRSKGGTGKR
jgi:hypothetical protein